MNETLKKTSLYIWIAIGILFLVGMPYFMNWQLNKMDRKLTCIYNYMQFLAALQIPELRKDVSVLENQWKYLEFSCDKSYIFTGMPTK